MFQFVIHSADIGGNMKKKASWFGFIRQEIFIEALWRFS
jgi:hypothetical protein